MVMTNAVGTFIRLTDAADVEKTKTYFKAGAQGEWEKTSNIEDTPVPQRSHSSSIENANWKPLDEKGIGSVSSSSGETHRSTFASGFVASTWAVSSSLAYYPIGSTKGTAI
jgi:hypothetical protein